MLRKIFLVTSFVLLIAGCNDKEVATDTTSFVQDEELLKVDEIAVSSEGVRKYQQPFEIQSIESQITSINNYNDEIPLDGVSYLVSLNTDEKIPYDRYLTYEFEIVTNSTLRSVISPQPVKGIIFLGSTTEGYIYELSFDTIYGLYSHEELDDLNNYRDFQVFVNYEGRRDLIN